MLGTPWRWASAATALTFLTALAWSTQGFVLGSTPTAVNPPCDAA